MASHIMSIAVLIIAASVIGLCIYCLMKFPRLSWKTILTLLSGAGIVLCFIGLAFNLSILAIPYLLVPGANFDFPLVNIPHNILYAICFLLTDVILIVIAWRHLFRLVLYIQFIIGGFILVLYVVSILMPIGAGWPLAKYHTSNICQFEYLLSQKRNKPMPFRTQIFCDNAVDDHFIESYIPTQSPKNTITTSGNMRTIINQTYQISFSYPDSFTTIGHRTTYDSPGLANFIYSASKTRTGPRFQVTVDENKENLSYKAYLAKLTTLLAHSTEQLQIYTAKLGPFDAMLSDPNDKTVYYFFAQIPNSHAVLEVTTAQSVTNSIPEFQELEPILQTFKFQ